jgi:hypothetical protein
MALLGAGLFGTCFSNPRLPLISLPSLFGPLHRLHRWPLDVHEYQSMLPPCSVWFVLKEVQS